MTFNFNVHTGTPQAVQAVKEAVKELKDHFENTLKYNVMTVEDSEECPVHMRARKKKEQDEPLFKFEESKPLEKDTIPVSLILKKEVQPTKKGITTTDLCFKSGFGTPMFSRRGQSTIPAKMVFQE